MGNINLKIPSEAEFANAFCNSLNERIEQKSGSDMAGISQQLNMSYQKLSNLRNNHKTLPPLQTVNNLLDYLGCSFESMIGGNVPGTNGSTYLEIFATFKFLLDKNLIVCDDYKIYYEDPNINQHPDDIYHGCFFNPGILYDIVMRYHELSRLLSDDLGLLGLWVSHSIERVPDHLFGVWDNKDLKSVISRRIVEISSLRQIRAKDLVDNLGLTQAAISQYRTGARVPPTYTLIKLARILGTSTDYLLGRSASFLGANSKQQVIQSLFALMDCGTICCKKVTRNGAAANEIMIADPILDTFCKRYAQYRNTVLALEKDAETKKSILNEWIAKNCADYHVSLLEQADFVNLEDLYQYNYYRDREYYRLSWDQDKNLPDILNRLLACYKELTGDHRLALNHTKAIRKRREQEDPLSSPCTDDFDEIFPQISFDTLHNPQN